MKKILVGILAVFGLLALLATGAFAGLAFLAWLGRPGVPSRTVLEIDLERGVVESVPPDPLARYMMEDAVEVRDMVDALERAADDRRVVGLVVWLGGESMNLAHIDEVRAAVRGFRESGKPAVAFAETFGEFGPGNGSYYLATAFDEIYLQPTGDLGLTGLVYESMFYRGLLDKLGIVPRMDQRHEYKSAMNAYTERSFTEAHRESLRAVLESRFGQIVRGIAAGRGLDEQAVRELIDRGPFYGHEAVDAHLVDGLLYRDEVIAQLRERTDDDARLLLLPRYLERAGRPHDRGTTVALIHGHGAVVRGASGYSPLTGESVMGAETVASAFRAAVRDRSVKAILFRVDSPGGSFVASDTIRREVARAREAGKPVVVSMGNLAGSGGYFVAMEADRIVAQPSTITASIGVLGGKLLTGGLWDRVGISWDEVHSSENARQWSPLHDYDEGGYARFQQALDRIYEDFTGRVADARGLPLDHVLEIARGRIWTGEDALELGLVDLLGGYPEALAAVREVLEEEPDAPLRIRRFPRERTALELLLGEKPDSSERVLGDALRETLKALQPEIRTLRRVAAPPPSGVLSMPDVSGLD